MKIIDCEQGSDEWFAARFGKPSASIFNQICTTNSAPTDGTTRTKLMNKLCAEVLTGEKIDGFRTKAMQRGNDLEPEAADMFSFLKGVECEEVGFILHDDENFGASPDRLIHAPDVEQGLEIKCPSPHTHIEYLMRQKLPSAYMQQVQGSMLVTGLSEWWFMSYCPNLPPMILLIQKDEEFCAALHRQLLVFIKEMNEKILHIESL